MSSAEDDTDQGAKRRKIQRACDVCRRKKIRCDGAQMPKNRCSNCIAYNFECTYVEAAKKRGPPKGYVESLENRLEKMEKLLQKLCPNGDFSQELGGPLDKDSWIRDRGSSVILPKSGRGSPTLASHSSGFGITSSGSHIPPGPSELTEDDGLEPSDDELVHMTLTQTMKQIRLDPVHPRFFGKSSGIRLLQTALDLKSEYAGERKPTVEETKERFLSLQTESERREFWKPKAYELAIFEEERATFRFPDADLISTLTDIYFVEVNPYLPLLHRPTFIRGISEGLHLRDDGFGSTVLLVCAIASRWCDDPRVFLEDQRSGLARTHSAGWKWFNQVQVVRKSLLAPPCLHDLQAYALSVIFLHGSSSPQACWTMAGIGIRLAQDVGAHRRKVYGPKLTVEDELWKRACWALITLDRQICCGLGRPCALQDEDFDLDLPADCDDEYWESDDPEKAFKQPEGKPSSVTYFICRIKLNQILAFALRTIYSINKSKVLLGFVGQQWEQHIVAELDSALNKWIDSVPDHLRWDPKREDMLFFNQSAYLHLEYYNLQIIIHRPFIPSPRKPSPLSFPSLAICTNAARSSSHVIDIHRRRCDNKPSAFTLIYAFTSGIVLLLNIWGGKRSGASSNPEKEMADVHKCMQVLKLCESKWHSGGRLWDILRDLASVSELPLPRSSPGPTFKRERDSDEPITSDSATIASSASATARQQPEAPRNIAGSRRVSNHTSAAAQPARSTSHLYALPVHSEDLGRIPLHPTAATPSDNGSSSDAPSPLSSWYQNTSGPTYGTAAPASPHASAPHAGPSNAPSVPLANSMGAMSAFPMDPLIYDQMMSSFADSGPVTGVPPMSTAGYEGYQPPGQSMPDNDTIAMWSNAPSGFEWDDWGSYISMAAQQGHRGDAL
ncbi:hypothetical protein PUNSTDRAFT_102126 [Punctularia strigosozonata HHB-11173 SS5]|uniref:uncharacterized protein n=1 Tax=Punctularia strigosozonata (strain HHB-11173) TaxID=741275 RepID=UPI0004417FB7|nr:uncharacterized protein PUNSTDRAFT_102126 [Punctularia strigosozonata HHB-11173 SS5]EIN10102.1 hypothetical protein PUNSTDRAFT_102126 [Punctularia strigosozonata HHB-11173 SS5]